MICVVKNGEYKIAQYGQWDGYPIGQGLDILNFLSSPTNLRLLDDNLKNVYFASSDELESQWVECGATKDSKWVDMEISNLHKEKYPQNSRDTGGQRF